MFCSYKDEGNKIILYILGKDKGITEKLFKEIN